MKTRTLFAIRVGLMMLVLLSGMHELGVCLTYMGKCEEGKDLLHRALIVHQQTMLSGTKPAKLTSLGLSSSYCLMEVPLIAVPLCLFLASHELGVCLTLLGRYREAEEHFRLALMCGSRRPGISTCVCFLVDVCSLCPVSPARIAFAGCLIEQFKVRQAESELRQALSLVEDTDGLTKLFGWLRASF